MKTLLETLRSRFSALSGPALAGIAAAVAGLVLLSVLAARWASQPSFELLYSGLDAREVGAVQAALAGSGVRYRVSQPPGPFVVHVDEEQYYAAQNAVALAGALERAPEGISSASGSASSVFLSAQERAQAALKREWQELEKQLEELDFVERARVSTSVPDRSPLRKSEPMTVAVTLTLRGRGDLTRAQASTVARLARFRFNVPAKNVLVTDQGGRALVEEGGDDSEAAAAQEIFEQARRYDTELERKANDALQRVFGPQLAHVVVSSTWTQEELESVKETVDPKNKVVVSETTSKTSTPTPGAGASSGLAGTAANLAGEPGTTASAAGEPATSSESTRSTLVGRETQLRRSRTPRLERLSLSLFLDESLKARQTEVEAAVKGAVGFDAQRGDSFAAMAAPFASVQRDKDGKPVATATEPVEAPSRLTELLLQRAVEIAVAGALLFLLWRSLRGAKRVQPEPNERPAGVEEDRWIEMLARTRVEELLKSDPDRIGAILSRWAAQAETASEKAKLQGAVR
jgi:flagellar M-ring protein FliF